MADNPSDIDYAKELSYLIAENVELGIPTSESGYSSGYSKSGTASDWSNPKDIGKSKRSKSLPEGAEPAKKRITDAVFVSSDYKNKTDNWKVRLSVPNVSNFRTSPLLKPLKDTDDSLIFPTTPQITISNTATYSFLNLVHTNYAFPVYQQSQIDPMNISASFPVQSVEEGQYWIAAIHYLRSMTKMFYGETSNKGAPPPVVKLNGYGDFVFNNVPVVITNFAVDLAPNVDYIKVPLKATVGNSSDWTYVPTDSTIAVTVTPAYSRTKTSSFNFDDFVNGDLRDQGFI